MILSDTYNGNTQVKRDGIKQNFTQEEIEEYIRCRDSAVYFINNYVKIINLDDGLVPFSLYPYQEKMINHFNDNRFSIILACRQSGKCASINTIVTVRNKTNGKIEKITLGELYERSSHVRKPSKTVPDNN